MADWKKTDAMLDAVIAEQAEAMVAGIKDLDRKAALHSAAAKELRERLEKDCAGLLENSRTIETEMATANERMGAPRPKGLLEAAGGDEELAAMLAGYMKHEAEVEAKWQGRLATLDPDLQKKIEESEAQGRELAEYQVEAEIYATRLARADAVRAAGALIGIHEAGAEDAVARAHAAAVDPDKAAAWFEAEVDKAPHWLPASQATPPPAPGGATVVSVRNSELADPVRGHAIWKAAMARAKEAGVELNYINDTANQG